jgi:uncharacterized protein YndB with AHSA1/START domain
MGFQDEAGVVRWRLHFRSAPEAVHRMLATAEGRARFWAESAEERDGAVEFRFGNGETWRGEVTANEPPRTFALRYFGGSLATFDLEPDGSGGTDLTLTETGVPEEWRHIHIPGWIPVLLALKAAVDFGVDLRNRDAARTWDHGYVDI